MAVRLRAVGADWSGEKESGITDLISSKGGTRVAFVVAGNDRFCGNYDIESTPGNVRFTPDPRPLADRNISIH
jgi:hypothetical protein